MNKSNMKSLITICFSFFLIFPCLVSAEEITGYVTSNSIPFTKEANIESITRKDFVAPGVLHYLDAGDQIKILNYNEPTASTVEDCSSYFYQISYLYYGKSYTGYICADAVKTNIDTSKYAEEFTALGFPESYFEKLTLLKDAHPNWIFTAYKTGLDWNEVVEAESVVGENGGISYIQSSNPIYLSLSPYSYDPETKTYKMMEAGGWYAANTETVAYYLDPRNFLDSINIFMFENLGYNSNHQTIDVVNAIFEGTNLLPYAEDYMAAATAEGNNISPVSLAARSRQEVVLSNGELTDSANGESGYYNFYNLGAFSSCDNPVQCAIDFASGYEGKNTSYNRPWTTAKDAIIYGAQYIANGYINQGQNTLYFQRWNVTSNTYGNYSHQYMTNVEAPISEARKTQKAYNSIEGLLEQPIEFIIPVYENMPETVSLKPIEVDQDAIDEIEKENQAEDEKVDVIALLQEAGYQHNDGYITGVRVGAKASEMLTKLSLKEDVKVAIKDASGVNTIAGDSALGTNYILSITQDEVETSYRIVIYGDVNGDGKVSAVDYVQVKNCIMASSNLNGANKLAADVNKDGTISAVDYVNVKNYIMNGNSVIE